MADPPQQQQQKQAYQPLHPSIRTKLDPEYVKIHDQIVQYLKPIELISPTLDQSLRSQPSPLAGYMQKTVEVGRVYDRDVDHYRIRVFVPPGRVPGGDKGWPCLVWYHGGGWALGGLDSENGFLTHLCKCEFLFLFSLEFPDPKKREANGFVVQICSVWSYPSTTDLLRKILILRLLMMPLMASSGW